MNYVQKIPNCYNYIYSIGNVYFNYYYYNYYNYYNPNVYYDKFLYNYQYYYSSSSLNDINVDFIKFINDNVKIVDKPIEGKCNYCNE